MFLYVLSFPGPFVRQGRGEAHRPPPRSLVCTFVRARAARGGASIPPSRRPPRGTSRRCKRGAIALPAPGAETPTRSRFLLFLIDAPLWFRLGRPFQTWTCVPGPVSAPVAVSHRGRACVWGRQRRARVWGARRRVHSTYSSSDHFIPLKTPSPVAGRRTNTKRLMGSGQRQRRRCGLSCARRARATGPERLPRSAAWLSGTWACWAHLAS